MIWNMAERQGEDAMLMTTEIELCCRIIPHKCTLWILYFVYEVIKNLTSLNTDLNSCTTSFVERVFQKKQLWWYKTNNTFHFLDDTII